MFGKLKDLERQDWLAVVVALLASAAAWSQDNRATVITWTAVIFVWALNMLFKWRGIQLGRRALTLILFVLAIGLALLFTPITLPILPVFSGDPAVYVSALIAFVSALVEIGGVIVAAATVLYNTLLKDVLEKLWYAPADELKPLEPDSAG